MNTLYILMCDFGSYSDWDFSQIPIIVGDKEKIEKLTNELNDLLNGSVIDNNRENYIKNKLSSQFPKYLQDYLYKCINRQYVHFRYSKVYKI